MVSRQGGVSVVQAYQNWFERAPTAYVVVDRQGRIVALNQVAGTLFGVDRERLRHRRLGLFLLPPERVRWRALLKRIFTGLDATLHDTLLTLRGHPVQPVRLRARLDTSGTQALVMMTTAWPVDADASASDLAASVYHVIDDAVMIADAENRIVSVNARFSEVTGYSSIEALNRKTNLLKSGRQDEAFYRQLWRALEETGRWQGEIWNRRKNGEEFLEALSIHTLVGPNGAVLRRVALFSDITHRRRAEDEVHWQANYDPLTGLPNRNLLFDRMDQEIRKAQRNRRSLALLYLDLDHFKEVNDSLGHQAGDTLLREAGYRLQACVREVDTVARLGGDEFTVVMGDLSDLTRVDGVAQQILQVLAQPFQIDSERVRVSASVGIALYPGDAQTTQELLNHADHAMYAAKKAGRNRCHYFTVQLQSALQERQQQIDDLHRALSEGQFRLYLQPVVDLSTGEPCLLEALLRWQHPERGLLQPAQFLALADEIGLIRKMGEWVFEQVAGVVRRLCASGSGSLRIGVNQSLRELCRDPEQASWADYLQELGLPPERLLVEINEHSLIQGGDPVKQVLQGRIEHGVAVALDDFGTGYASMTCLEQIALDYVKIDAAVIGSLPERLAAQAFVEATLVLARKLGIAVIAEGVETEAQRQYLLDVGCDCAQGYLFGAPMPAEDYRPD